MVCKISSSSSHEVGGYLANGMNIDNNSVANIKYKTMHSISEIEKLPCIVVSSTTNLTHSPIEPPTHAEQKINAVR